MPSTMSFSTGPDKDEENTVERVPLSRGPRQENARRKQPFIQACHGAHKPIIRMNLDGSRFSLSGRKAPHASRLFTRMSSTATKHTARCRAMESRILSACGPEN